MPAYLLWLPFKKKIVFLIHWHRWRNLVELLWKKMNSREMPFHGQLVGHCCHSAPCAVTEEGNVLSAGENVKSIFYVEVIL